MPGSVRLRSALLATAAVIVVLFVGAAWDTAPARAALAQQQPGDAVCTSNLAGPVGEPLPAGALLTQLATDRMVYQIGQPVTLVFSITNAAAVPITVAFASSPAPVYALSVSSAGSGAALWVYPAAPGTDAPSQCVLAPGATYDLMQVWNQTGNAAGDSPVQAPAGDYVLRGQLAVACGAGCDQLRIPEAVLFRIEPPANQPPAVAPAPLVDLCSAGTVVSNSYYSYPAGWNIVGGPEGRVLLGNTSLFRYDPSSMAYVSLPIAAPLELGAGYWAYFPRPMSGPTPPGTARVQTVDLPPGKYVLVGNPRPSMVSVQGADAVYTYDPATGYSPAAVLRPGQGAWAIAAAGGTLTLSDLSHCSYPT